MSDRKTSHQIARELLALPDLPTFHYDPSFVDRADNEENPSFGEVSVCLVDACEGMSAEEIEEMREEGGFVGKFISLEGDQLPEMDRPELTDPVRLAKIFADWEREYRENPDAFMSAVQQRAASLGEYGDLAAACFLEMFARLRQKGEA